MCKFRYEPGMRTNYSILLLLLAFVSIGTKQSFAGIKWVDIGVDGLTCSMCSRSVEMSLRRLDFVDSVAMSLEKTEGRVYFNPTTPVNFDQLAKAVVNAGFSVRFVQIEFSFNDITVSNDGHFSYLGQAYEWLGFKNQMTQGAVTLKVVDENFLSKKERLQWKKKVSASSPQGNQKKVLHVVRES
jgi:copper chaperone CopZ